MLRNNSSDRTCARSLDRSICVASCACSEMGAKHNAEEHADPQIAKAIRTKAKKSFEITMRQAAMEFDELSGGSGELDFREFSRMIREREVGVHTEQALKERFDAIDKDGGGTIDAQEYMAFALIDAFERSAAHLVDLFSDWDADGSGSVDKVEFRNVVRSFGFECGEALIDKLFARFDLHSTGELSLRMVSRRLQAEVAERESRGRRMAELRCLQWRASANVVQLIDPVALDPKLGARAGARSQILSTLRAQQARVMDLFRSWDADGDALISRTEFRQAVLVLGLDGVPPKQVDELFNELDKDGSGEISFNEMRDAIKGPEETAPVEEVGNTWKGWGAEAKHAAALTLSDKGRGASIVRGIRLSPDYDLIAQLTHGLASNWGRVTWLFQTWDTDRNGTISRLELRKALVELGLGEHPRAVDSLFDAIDANRSGGITLDEFQLALQASLRTAQSEQLMGVSRGIAPAAFPRMNLPAVSGAASPEPSPRNRVGQFGQWSSAKPNVLVLPPMRRPIELMKPRRSRNSSPVPRNSSPVRPVPRNSSPERAPAFDPIPTPPITARPTMSHRRHILRPRMRLQALDRVPLIVPETARLNPTTAGTTAQVDAATDACMDAALVPQTRIRRSLRNHLMRA